MFANLGSVTEVATAVANGAEGCGLLRSEFLFLERSSAPDEDEQRTPTHAIVSESADIETGGAEWALDSFLGTVRIRSESERPVFVGIGPATEVDRYLDYVEHDVVTDLEDEPRYSRAGGGEPDAPPGAQQFWVASTSGSGEQTLDGEPEDGDWRAVVMNADGRRGASQRS